MVAYGTPCVVFLFVAGISHEMVFNEKGLLINFSLYFVIIIGSIFKDFMY